MLQAPRLTICPNTVLLFEPRISNPALRVTKINFYLNFDRFSTNLIQIWWKIDFHENFRNLHFLSSADATFTPHFTLAIIYRLTQHFLRTSALICYPGKWNEIENRTDGPQSKIDISTAGAQICCKPPGWRLPRTPYYSSSWGLAILLYESLKSIFIRISIHFW